MLFRILSILGLASLAFAGDAPKLDTGNTAWMMVATAFVMLMTPAGLALFYAGMTRAKNTLNTYMMVFSAYALATVVWVFWAYSLTFGDDIAGVIGNLKHAFLSGISYSDLESSGYPSYVFVAFQGTFAAITVAIASGSIIERTKFSTWLLFVILWVTFVYAPVAHMVWGGGFLYNAGALDFAGGTVVHMNGGLAGLVAALMIGKRKGYPKTQMMPSSVVLTALGAALLWFGWFGFNAGSEFAADEVAGSAFLMTNFAAAAATVTWIILDYLKFGKPTLLGAASGAVAGLVAITPAAGFVDIVGALIIGIGGSVTAFFGVTVLKKVFKYDDSLDAFGVHFIAGLWGAIATGIFALKDLAWDGSPLKDHGDRLGQIWVQVESVIVTIVFVAIMTAIVLKIASILTGGARVDEEAEVEGLDSSEHGEKGFNL
ncbi:ammonium transporter [Caminibacter mediatlanticus TB-2]|uniref:Ammonium transporter n=1 Tax=Caminibacter mediatlanticus TB-2 TaxID=391592 RepID=A0AAI9F1Z0_9BACT|nr:ammonium transporter [Caminibacter mediatlanticus]EDM23253.1 AMMONIUM TRANSPORTER, AMTB [Caminibacter mediatlanticus TB-2]QCT94179.1 ammonium transporter [Caminibacter mediatlanticus TB-2]